MADPARVSWTDQFPGNFQWSNAILVCKGMAPFGAVSLSDIDRVAAQLEAGPVTPETWRDAWLALAEGVEAQAREALDRGAERTAGTLLLRAGNYIYTGERFVQPGPEKRAIAAEAFRCLHAGLRMKHPEIEFLEIPLDDQQLPALYMPARGADGPAPTVVVVNGMDNCKEMSVLFAGLEFAARGFNTLALDGPGQGESLRLRGIHSRPDYEASAEAALGVLRQRRDVDLGRVAIMGYSFGGAYAARIAAKARGYAAGVAMTAGHWDLAAFQSDLYEKVRRAQKTVAQSNFQFQWVVGAASPEEAIERADAFGVRHHASEIRIPFLVTHGENDRIIPVANATRLYEAIPQGVEKGLKIFTATEGGCEHAHVDDRLLGIAHVADWLERVLASERVGEPP